MYRIALDVRDQKIKVKEIVELVSNTIGEYVAVFSFSEDWDGYIKTAVFKTSDGKVYECLIEADQDISVPKEVLECSGFMRIGVYGVNRTGQVKPTVYSSAIGIKVGADTDGETVAQTAMNNMSVIINEITRQTTISIQDAIDTAVSQTISDLAMQMPKILSNTKQYWDSQTALIAQPNTIYIYTNYSKVRGMECVGLKVGDGTSYLIDMPFLDEVYADHINNTDVHITPQERAFWNAKVRCYDGENPEELIFTTN